MSAHHYSEEEWRRTIAWAEEHADELTEPNPNAPLPLTPAELELLRLQHTARTLDIVGEWLFGRNTP